MQKELEEMYYYYYNQYLNEKINFFKWDEIKETIRNFEYWKTQMEKNK